VRDQGSYGLCAKGVEKPGIHVFLEMYGKIEEEQEFARQQQIMAARYKRVKEWRHRNLRIELGMWAMGMAVVWLVLAGMMMQIASLTGPLPEWFSLDVLLLFVSNFGLYLDRRKTT